MHRVAAAAGVLVLAWASNAGAAEPAALRDSAAPVVPEQRSGVPSAPASARSGDVGIEIAARAGILAVGGSYKEGAGAALTGVELDFRPSTAWRVGGYIENQTGFLVGGDGAGDFGLLRFGARGSWHSRPERVVDPWFGFSVGALHGQTLFHEGPESTRWGMDLGVDVGMDFHLGSHVALGPLLSVITPLGDRAPDGVPRFPSAFSFPLFPLIRLAVDF